MADGMYTHHEAIFILVVYFHSSYWWFGKEARVVGNDVSTGSAVKFVEVALFDDIYAIDVLGKKLVFLNFLIGFIGQIKLFYLSFLNFLKNLTPIRHL